VSPSPSPDFDPSVAVFAGGGEMGRLCREKNWADTPLGPVDGWPQSLRTAAGMVLTSGFPSIVLWGPKLVQVYNDGYIPITGAKHPWALGVPTREVWPEVWHLNEPLFAAAHRGETVSVVDAPYALRRGGPEAPPEETYFTLSFSPIRDETGAVGGVLVTAIETTREVEARRLQGERERLFRELELERSRLAFVFHSAPSFLAVLRGPEHRFELANDAYYQLVGHRDIIGKPVLEALPEVRGQGFTELLGSVLRTGSPFVGREMPIMLARTPGAEPEERFVDLTYMPLIDAGGAREGIIAHGMDVTDHVLSRIEVERLLGESEQERADAEEARAEAEHANRAKSDFLAIMSHEIRTPINAIMGYTDLLDAGVGGSLSQSQREYLQRIKASSAHLLGLVEDVLDLAKTEAGRMSVVREKADAADVIANALSLVEPQANAKGVVLENRCAADCEYPYLGDPDRVRQVLVNLLSNAVKFTPAGGRVVLDADVTRAADPAAYSSGAGPWTRLTVRDTGIGIAPDQLEAVFRPFVQAESGHTRSKGGTGLGLTISRQLARLMGGDVTLESALGEGAAFTLWLPAHAGEEKALAPELARAGEVLQAELDRLVGGYVARLRADPAIPAAHELDRVDLEDHVASFLVDIAQTLVILAETGGRPDLIRDGSDLQRLISERHGAQRARLGWTAEALQREFQILGEEVEAALHRGSPTDSVASSEATETLRRLLSQAEEISVEGFRDADALLPKRERGLGNPDASARC
jgi:signal transduction histidine kinase